MLDVHSRMHQFRNLHRREDPIPPLVTDILRDSWVICFDEFQVTDVADAMILYRLFGTFYMNGGIIVSTSNRAPIDLYQNGLNRPLFLPFIDLLQQYNHVHNFHSRVDYRLTGTHVKNVFFNTQESNPIHVSEILDQMFHQLTHGEPTEVTKIDVRGRNWMIPKTARGVADCSFEYLCLNPNGPGEYYQLAQQFHTLILRDVPILNAHKNRNEARRLIYLIDELYNHKVKLICSAAAAPEFLFIDEMVGPHAPPTISHVMDDMLNLQTEEIKNFMGEEEKFMFGRVVSRLKEMSTAQYLESAHQKS
jgi:predicted ATPase